MPYKTKATLYKKILHKRTVEDGWWEVEHVLLQGKWLGYRVKGYAKETVTM